MNFVRSNLRLLFILKDFIFSCTDNRNKMSGVFETENLTVWI